jgi:GNAT superfamily N-acetyltransferase
VNVGLHRLGIAPSRLLRVAKDVVTRPELDLEGLMAQPRDDKNALEGFEKLNRMHDQLASHGIVPKRLHFANSTVLLTHPETTADGARIGILLYGVLPPEQYGRSDLGLYIRPVMALTTCIVQVRDLLAGSRIGYRARSRTTRDSIIGTIPIGYSHGLDRTLSSGGYVLVRGEKAPFIGTISMNSSTVDLTGVDGACIGDRVTVIGRDGEHEIVINDLASHSGTISAELMVRFGSGIARRYRTRSHDGNGNGQGIDIAHGVRLRVVHAEKDLPAGVDARDIIAFLKNHLAPYDDPVDVIREALDYSLSSYRDGDGFVVLATEGRDIVGVLTCARTCTSGFIPENVIGYVCVHRYRRRQGFGRRLVTTAIKNAEGDFKLHVENENPADAFYEKLGFHNDYKEMRLLRGSRGRTWRT